MNMVVFLCMQSLKGSVKIRVVQICILFGNRTVRTLDISTEKLARLLYCQAVNGALYRRHSAVVYRPSTEVSAH